MFLTNSRCKVGLFGAIGDWYHYLLPVFLRELYHFYTRIYIFEVTFLTVCLNISS